MLIGCRIKFYLDLLSWNEDLKKGKLWCGLLFKLIFKLNIFGMKIWKKEDKNINEIRWYIKIFCKWVKFLFNN